MTEKRKISVTVGFAGTKIHPAFCFMDENGKSFVATTCGCPHTNSGHKSLNPVADGWEHVTCSGGKS